MAGFLKAILIAILAVASILLFVNMAFFFPWYMEIVQTTFEVSQIVSTDNYLALDSYEDALDEVRNKPIFKERAADVKIEAFHEDGRTAVEQSGPHSVSTYYYDLDREEDKPYVQMGKLVTVTIHAVYPLRMRMFGEEMTFEGADVPVSFSMTTVTTRHYKDLEYDYGPDGHTLGDYDD